MKIESRSQFSRRLSEEGGVWSATNNDLASILPSMLQLYVDNCDLIYLRLYLHTKLANPHYRPEVAAQTTLVNFCVTESGLEEQLLAAVVVHEQPVLQEQAAALVRQLADFTLLLTSLEDNLLKRLAASQVDLCLDQYLLSSKQS